jgi:hypothetical protein
MSARFQPARERPLRFPTNPHGSFSVTLPKLVSATPYVMVRIEALSTTGSVYWGPLVNGMAYLQMFVFGIGSEQPQSIQSLDPLQRDTLSS